MTEMLKLMDQYFKPTFINIFKDVRENMDIMCQQERNQNKEMKTIETQNKCKFSE